MWEKAVVLLGKEGNKIVLHVLLGRLFLFSFFFLEGGSYPVHCYIYTESFK